MKNKASSKAASIKSHTKHAKKLLRKDKGVKKAKVKFQKIKKNDRGEMFDPKFKEELEKGDDIEIDYDDMMGMIDRENDGSDQEMEDRFEQQWIAKTKKLQTIKEAVTKKKISAQKKAVTKQQQKEEEEESEAEAEGSGDENEDSKSKQISYDKLDNLSYLQSLLLVRQKKDELRDTLAQLSNAIMEHPELNIRKMNKLLALLDLNNTDPQFGLIFVTVQALTCQSICLVLCDICPNFRYSERFRKETPDAKLKLKRETIKTQEYEKSVVQFYQLYLKRLIRMVEGTVPAGNGSKAKSNFIKTMISSAEARLQISTVAISCLAKLLEAHPNFNYSDQIIDILSKVFCNTTKDSVPLRTICAASFRRLFQTDTLGESTLKAVNLLGEHILQNNFRVDPSVFRSFSYLDLKELAQDIEAVKQRQLGASKSKREKKDRKVMSRKERKNAKKMGKLEKELLEAEATESRDKIMENKVEIHKKLFALYFRFLKRCAEVDEMAADSKIDDLHFWYTPIFCVMFDDIAKFSVYLNDIYVYELIELMLKMINNSDRAVAAADEIEANSEIGHLFGINKLRCLKAIFKILSLTDHSLNIDFHQPYNILYDACGDSRIVLTNSYPVLLECFNEMVVKQHKLLSQKRLVAFAQRMFSILPYLIGSDAQKLIETLNKLFALIPSLAETLFDSEDVLESGPTKHANKEVTLDTAGVLPCSIFELGSLMRQHCNQRIRKFATKLLEMP